MMQRLMVWGVTAVTAAACATPDRIVPLPAPQTSGVGKADLSGVTVVLREFQINGPPQKEIDKYGPQLRRDFMQYVASRSEFAAVTSGNADAATRPNALLLDVIVDASYTSNRTYILDYAFFWLFGLISPNWGEAKVKVRLTAVDKGMRPILVEENSENIEYSMTAFGWYRTGPQEDAFAQAYSRAFDTIAQRIAVRRDMIVMALEGGKAMAGMPMLNSTVSSATLQCKKGATSRSIAVLPLQIKRLERELGALLDELLVSNVSASGCFKVISSSDINAMLGLEKLKDVSGCSDTACAAEIGGALGVDLLLSGTVGRLGDNLLVSLSVIDITKSEVLGRLTSNIPQDENQIPGYLREAVRKLFANVPEATGR
ncbi:MAG: hypothetical protein HYZ27_03480 [Deltaproteobacteria bacterium]|nr:hypothetical protein [Deltaproteobacteria bacterium]